MSVLLLEDFKAWLPITHSHDDVALQMALDAAEDEAIRFMDRDYLPVVPIEVLSESQEETDPISEDETASEAADEIAPSVKVAVFILAKANFEGARPDGFRGLLDLEAYRKRAETMLMPYRRHIGV